MPRRASALLIAATLVAAVACSGPAADDGTVSARPTATAQCGEVEFPRVDFGSHLLGDADPPVPYSSTPPSSGWHLSGRPVYGVASSEASEPMQVTTLETGGVVVTHNGLSADDEQLLASFVEDNEGRALATPYDQIDEGQVVIAAWGVLQRCEGLDVPALQSFADTYIGPALGD